MRRERHAEPVPVVLPVLEPDVVDGDLRLQRRAAIDHPTQVRAQHHVAPVTQSDGIGQISHRERIPVAGLEGTTFPGENVALPDRDIQPGRHTHPQTMHEVVPVDLRTGAVRPRCQVGGQRREPHLLVTQLEQQPLPLVAI